MKTILVAYDNTEPSKRALERTAMVAEAFGSKVIVTSIAPLIHSSPRSAASRDRSPHIPTQEEVEGARATLEQRGIAAQALQATGDPASAIADLAEEQHVDLVVLGTREVGALQRLLGMSVSQQVAKRVQCDVLIVHPEHTPAT